MRLFRRSNKTPLLPDAPKRRVLFVSHEATRTGAPKIILNVLKHFRENCDVRCETVLQRGGDIGQDFHDSSHITDCLNQPHGITEKLKRKIKRIVHRDKGNLPMIALCNSIESRFIASELARHKIPVISLVHELPSSYEAEDYQMMLDASKQVIFPVQEVFEAASKKVNIAAHQSTVLSQGLLDPNFGTGIDRSRAATEIRERLFLPPDAFIVLGCGTLDLRKGIDHFAAVARRVTELNHASDKPIHFVWVGGGPQWTHSPFHYVQLDLEKSKANKFVHFIGEQDNVEPWFVGSDAFFLSSRVDPFPCVVHEAMAASLPVITFADSGGAQTAVNDGAGFIVPYGDHEQTAALIRTLATQPLVAATARERSLARVHSRYRFEDYGDRLIELCEFALGESIRKVKTDFQPKIHVAA